MKSRYKTLILILVTSLIIPAYAYAKELPKQYEVPGNKVWNITFKEAVELSSLEENILITDSKGNTVKTDITLSEDKRTASVISAEAYTPGETYTIHVKHKIKSTSGKYLDQEYTKEFTVNEEFTVKSSAYNPDTTIPIKYVLTDIYGGLNTSIPLQWSGAPKDTKSFAIFMYDLNPIASNWVHWAVVNIPAGTTEIKEGASGTVNMPAGSKELYNDFGTLGYGGPCPPPGSGNHEYKIILYALDTENISLSGSTSLYGFQDALKDHILAQTEFSGYFAQ